MPNRRQRRRGRQQRRRKPRHRRVRRRINYMPDEILHHILSFLPTYLAARTCVLSRRWRHVWRESPSLDIDDSTLRYRSINKILTSYTAPIITSFNLSVRLNHITSEVAVTRWIEFAISRKVQKLSLTNNGTFKSKTYSFPDSMYLCSSVKQLTVKGVVRLCDLIPKCKVSWKSLRNLSLCYCKLSIDDIISGCPILESLTLETCSLLDHERLDLSKSLSLRSLDIDGQCPQASEPIVIIAPHIHYLRLTSDSDTSKGHKPFALVDVSSLIEANLNTVSYIFRPWEAAYPYQTMVLEMLPKLHNVERLTIGEIPLQILSDAELRGVPFPTLKVQTLVVKTELVRFIIPAISRLLQNSPGLKQLTIHTSLSYTRMDDTQRSSYDVWFVDLGRYLDTQDLDQSWRSEYKVFATSQDIFCNHALSMPLALFLKLVLRNAKTLERIVVWLGDDSFDAEGTFKEMLQMVETLSRNNNVSIVLKPSNLY